MWDGRNRRKVERRHHWIWTDHERVIYRREHQLKAWSDRSIANKLATDAGNETKAAQSELPVK